MLSKKQKKIFGILVAIASITLVISSVGSSLFYLIGR